MDEGSQRSSLPANPAVLSYTMLRHIGLILDELSYQGLEVWRNERNTWQWRWRDTGQQAQRGMWALGETVVDAIATRYPTAFMSPVEAAEEHEDSRLSCSPETSESVR